MPDEQYSAISRREQVTFQQGYNYVRFVPYWHFIVLIHWNNSPRIDMSHITLILNQPVLVIAPYCCVHDGEAANTNFIIWFDPIGGGIYEVPHSGCAC
jgi:hypothetical protein